MVNAKVAEVAKTQIQPLYISGYNAKALQECETKFDFNELGLIYDGAEKSAFIKECCRKVLKGISEGVTEIEQFVNSVFAESYKLVWFDSEAEYITTLQKDFVKVSRIGKYIIDNGYTIKSLSVPYKAEFNSPIIIGKKTVDGIAGTYDAILEKDGVTTAVILKNGSPEYSVRARKPENMPENSVEILTAWLGGIVKIPDLRVELWYLNNKDDTGSEVMEIYNHREGKNIIGASYENVPVMEVFNRWKAVLSKKVCADCSNCRHKSLCAAKKELRTDDLTEAVEVKTAQAEKTFTEQQLKVINHIDGPMCVVAVPGAGKTTSLVQRLVNLTEKGVPAKKILFVTFTKKAAKEIEERVDTILSEKRIKGRPTISTYNSLGFSILKENPLYVGSKRLKLATDIDRYAMIKDALAVSPIIKGVSYSGISLEYGLIRRLDAMFEEIHQAEIKEPGKGEETFIEKYKDRKDVDGILKVYHTYKEMYDKGSYICYDEQISLVNELFDRYPVLRKKYADKYEYVMVDEFQDTNSEQADMIYALAKEHGNIVIVGDDDQSIYGWRGGSSKYMLNFKADFPSAKMVYMSDNFRSGSGLLKAADTLIDGNAMRYEKHIVPHIEDTSTKPVYIKGTSQYLYKIISTALSHGAEPGDICVLARNNKRLDEVQSILEGFPISLGKDYFIEDKAFLAVYDVLTLFFKGMDNDVALYRVLAYRNADRGLYKANRFTSLYNNLVNQKAIMPFNKVTPEVLEWYESNREKNLYIDSVCRLIKCFEQIEFSDLRTAVETIIKELFELDYHQMIDALCDKADEQGIVKMADLFNMMTNMIEFSSKDRVGYDVSKNAINLITSHDSKGKEFNTVIIYGVEDYNDSDEEVRVLYVSMTRAKKNLYMLETSVNQNTSIFNKIKGDVQVLGC